MLFKMQNPNGIRVSLTNFGAALTECLVPDQNGQCADITLGFDSIEKYLDNAPRFGVIIGRFANRLDRGRFQLKGKHYQLAINSGRHHIHGGREGFDKKLWEAIPLDLDQGEGIRMRYISPHGEEGYPGTLKVEVDYILNHADEFIIRYLATTDKTTPINLTNHAYWNLAGEGSGHIGTHRLLIHAEFYTPNDEALIPTGEIRSVKSTPLDFQKAAAIGPRLEKIGGMPVGFDHNFVLSKSEFGALEKAAWLIHPASGRCMEILTTEPAIQFYTANFLDGSLIGKSGKRYGTHEALCLECQHFPNSPNHPHFPSTTLHPGQTYEQSTIYRFSIDSCF